MYVKHVKYHQYLCLIITLALTSSGNCANRTAFTKYESLVTTKSIEELDFYYEDQQNALLAVTESSNNNAYGVFYDRMDNTLVSDNTMDVIFFGSSVSFMRLDSETILHILQRVNKNKIPISRTILIWDLITGGNNAALLQGREYLALGNLLNFVPEEDLYYVNFGDSSVLHFFTSTYIDYSPRVLGILIASYRRYYGNDWFLNGSFVNELGYLYCGIQTYDLRRMSPSAFMEITTETFNKLHKCKEPQKQAFYDLAVNPQAYGPPSKWTSNEVTKLGYLFTRIPKQDIVLIRLEAISAIGPNHMKSIDQRKLDHFCYQQVLLMNKNTRRIYILRKLLKNNNDLDMLNYSGAMYSCNTILFLVICLQFVTV